MIWTPRKQQHQQRRRLQQKKVDVAEVDAMSQRKRRSASGRISPLVARGETRLRRRASHARVRVKMGAEVGAGSG